MPTGYYRGQRTPPGVFGRLGEGVGVVLTVGIAHAQRGVGEVADVLVLFGAHGPPGDRPSVQLHLREDRLAGRPVPALNLNVHFHSMVPDGVWVKAASGCTVEPPDREPDCTVFECEEETFFTQIRLCQEEEDEMITWTEYLVDQPLTPANTYQSHECDFDLATYIRDAREYGHSFAEGELCAEAGIPDERIGAQDVVCIER
jgi:hypothetical protein